MNMEEKKKKAQTPEETAQALSDLAEKLEEMDKAEGVFGEAITDAELDDVAGGHLPTKPANMGLARCKNCGTEFYYDHTVFADDPPFCSAYCRKQYEEKLQNPRP